MKGFLFFCIFIILQTCKAKSNSLEYGILKTVYGDKGLMRKYCYRFFDSLAPIPNAEELVVFNIFDNEANWNPCDAILPNANFTNRLVLLKTNFNCSMINTSINLQEAGAKGVIFVANRWKERVNLTDTSLNVGVISITDYNSISKEILNSTVAGGAYKSYSKPNFFDTCSPSIIIWVMAVFSIMVGSFWSGIVRNSLYETEKLLLTEVRSTERHVPKEPQVEISLHLTPKMVVIIVVTMCLVLVSMWFLLHYVVYFLIAMFCIAAANALYCSFEPLVLMCPFGKCRTRYFNNCLIRGHVELRQFLLALVAVAIPVIWVVFRRQSWAWILQDILGIILCIHVMVRLRLPNLMICSLLLTLLILYDIFFVFITPFITPGGTSIMVDVATGGRSGEHLPMLIQVPLFVYPELNNICFDKRIYSSLGFGDIIVPGLLVSYVHSFDLKVKTPFRLYYVISIISYGIGLLITFIGLYMMAAAQPALFYLVPSLLIPTVVVAAVRGELAAMWSDSTKPVKGTSETDENQTVEGTPYQGNGSDDPLFCTTPTATSQILNEDSYQDSV